jgi:hypothetical protein
MLKRFNIKFSLKCLKSQELGSQLNTEMLIVGGVKKTSSNLSNTRTSTNISLNSNKPLNSTISTSNKSLNTAIELKYLMNRHNMQPLQVNRFHQPKNPKNVLLWTSPSISVPVTIVLPVLT